MSIFDPPLEVLDNEISSATGRIVVLPPWPPRSATRSPLPSLSISNSSLEVFVNGISSATGRVFVHGIEREGLMFRTLYMRLFHLGLFANVVGDVTTPPIAAADLFLASTGPNNFSTVEAICRVTKPCGMQLALVTAQPQSGSEACRCADAIVYLPTQTMADDEETIVVAAATTWRPMGSFYEGGDVHDVRDGGAPAGGSAWEDTGPSLSTSASTVTSRRSRSLRPRPERKQPVGP